MLNMIEKELSNGIVFSETGEVLITESKLEELLEKIGYDIFDGGSIDTTKVENIAYKLGLKNLGSYAFINENFLYLFDNNSSQDTLLSTLIDVEHCHILDADIDDKTIENLWLNWLEQGKLKEYLLMRYYEECHIHFVNDRFVEVFIDDSEVDTLDGIGFSNRYMIISRFKDHYNINNDMETMIDLPYIEVYKHSDMVE